MARILIVDDEPMICWGLSRLVRAMGHRVDSASSAEHGVALAAAARPDVLILDVRLPGVDGLTAMESFRLHLGDAPIIIITAFGDLETAVAAVEKGAFEYVVKPFDLAEIRAAIERALREKLPAPAEPAAESLDGMLGRTPAMQTVFKRIALAARSDAAVLLHGEPGVGKEVAARAIHRHSERRDAPFVAVNVAALSPVLAEAEMFGQIAGAIQPRRGLLVQADSGILFLDQAADIPLALQAKLLRALEQGEVVPVGSDRPVPARFRVISATHQDLHSMVRRGEFRQDLLVRLSTFEIAIPPLRERREDVPLLANYFAAQRGAAAVLAEETLNELSQRPWYGNVRELRTAVEHALVVARTGAVLPSHLPAPLPMLGPPADQEPVEAPSLEAAVAALAKSLLDNPTAIGLVYDRFLEKVEPPLLAAALQRNGRRCAPAARALGLHRTTLKRKLDQYGIDEAGGAGGS